MKAFPKNMKRKVIAVQLIVLAAVSFPRLVRSENWPQWRGPTFNGATTEKNLPATFSKTENVVWTAPMPGPSGSTPVVFGDYVFVASTDETARTCIGLAFDRKS